jgi:hypothetical protein
MLMVLTNSSSYGGLGGLVYDAATGKFTGDGSTTVVVNGVSQTTGLTYGQAANYVEAMLLEQTGSTINITEDNIRFISAAYNDILNRPAEGGGLAYWAQTYATGNYTESQMYQLIVDGAVASGEILELPDDNNFSITPSVIVSRDQFTYSVAASVFTENFEGLQETNYTDLLADDNLTRMNTTQEFFTDMYQSYLGREPETEGLEFWVNQANDLGIEAAIDNFRSVADTNLEAGLEPGANAEDTVFIAGPE